MPLRDLPHTWGATDVELRDTYLCECLIEEPRQRLLRAVTVETDESTTFRWVCQLKVAPYSYDLLDNRGRRSPRNLTPGAERLAIGQLFVGVFRISDYDEGRHITATSTPRGTHMFGRMALTYRVEPLSRERCRLVACLAVPRGGRVSRMRSTTLAFGDLVMMRKQLLTLRDRAEAMGRRRLNPEVSPAAPRSAQPSR